MKVNYVQVLKMFQNTMSRDKFEFIFKLFHFPNHEEHDENHNRLVKFNSLLILLKDRFRSIYMPGSVVTTDETMVS